MESWENLLDKTWNNGIGGDAKAGKTENSPSVSNVIGFPVHPHDPRPDLSRDTILWQQMLAGAQDIDQRYGDPEQKLYSALLYMRAKGTILQRTPSGKLALRPYIDPAGNDAWTSQEEYDKEKIKVLDPVRERLIELLGKMAA